MWCQPKVLRGIKSKEIKRKTWLSVRFTRAELRRRHGISSSLALKATVGTNGKKSNHFIVKHTSGEHSLLSHITSVFFLVNFKLFQTAE